MPGCNNKKADKSEICSHCIKKLRNAASAFRMIWMTRQSCSRCWSTTLWYECIVASLSRCRWKSVTTGSMDKSSAKGGQLRPASDAGAVQLRCREGRKRLLHRGMRDCRTDKAIIHERCALVVRTGSIGTAVKVDARDRGAVISSHLIRLEFEDEAIAAAVAAYLCSPAVRPSAQNQLWCRSTADWAG